MALVVVVVSFLVALVVVVVSFLVALVVVVAVVVAFFFLGHVLVVADVLLTTVVVVGLNLFHLELFPVIFSLAHFVVLPQLCPSLMRHASLAGR